LCSAGDRLSWKIEMAYSAEQMIATRQANVQALQGLTSWVYAGFEQLSELNRATSKAMVAGSLSPTQALLAAKKPTATAGPASWTYSTADRKMCGLRTSCLYRAS
jgi:hypothetical protein